ncbi:MAG: argininosuccinate synthase [Chitinivibrionales bacterium]|nr:argininosuccinate synthase [Chitinivibrionales bacterium]
MGKEKIVVAYSGGLDTSVMVHWLAATRNAEIVTVTGNLGQPPEELAIVKQKALSTGAVEAYVLDLREEFVKDYVWKALKASAIYEGSYPLATALSRPLLADKLVQIATQEHADCIAHGCTGKGNDQVRFEVGIQTLAPHVAVLAPLRQWHFKSRQQEIDYALEHKIPVPVTKKSDYSIDENLWGVSIECGSIEDVSQPPPQDAFRITRAIEQTPDTPEKVIIEFEEGIPVALNGEKLDGVRLIEQLNRLGGIHGIGRIDMVENRIVGIKSREVYEAPAAVILHRAHQELERLVLDRQTFRFKSTVSDTIANLIYDGLWFSPLLTALMKFIDETQAYVSGSICLQLSKATVTVISRNSPFSLYETDLATYCSRDRFDHRMAEGFISLYGLTYKTLGIKQRSRQTKIVSSVV